MSYKLITAPVVEPVTLEYFKARTRIDGTEYDAVIPSIIKESRELLEHRTGCALISQVHELTLDTFPEAFELRPSPVISVVSIKYLDVAGIEQTLDLADTILDNSINHKPGYITVSYGKAWPETHPVPNAVKVRFVAGYGSVNDVPQCAKEWIVVNANTGLMQLETFVQGTASEIPSRFIDSKLDSLWVP